MHITEVHLYSLAFLFVWVFVAFAWAAKKGSKRGPRS